jgi:D-alanyl-D-alanine carboxypeptidase (penicillin-binding protein 5/6)
MLKILSLCLAVLILAALPFSAVAENTAAAESTAAADKIAGSDNTPARPDLHLTCKSAVLMEASTGRLLYAHNPAEALPPASVTKIMTLLLVMECMEAGTLKWDDVVTASAHAASMGGSQIFLKEGEQMTARDLIKSVVIASANDGAVALAEHTYGSEEAFVKRMNQRAAELGMVSTHFENTNGLDDTAQGHVTSAQDIAIMSRALIRHKEILEFSSTWMDTIRGGAFGLTNTNRLVRFYRGCNGLKTGSTAKAGFCVSVTAERDGMTLICVVMGAESRDVRNAEASRLLDYGFATYGLFTAEGGTLPPVPVTRGREDEVSLTYPRFTAVLPKADMGAVERTVTLPDAIPAPVRAGEAVGKITYACKGISLGEVPITAAADVEKLGFWDIWRRIFWGMIG